MTTETLDVNDPGAVYRWVGDFALRTEGITATDAIVLGAITGAFKQTAEVRDLACDMLTEIAGILKGPPAEGSVWGFEDLPELVRVLVAKNGGGLH